MAELPAMWQKASHRLPARALSRQRSLPMTSIAASIPGESRRHSARLLWTPCAWNSASRAAQQPFTERGSSVRPWSDDAEIFRHRRAANVLPSQRWTLGILTFLGLQSVLYFAWW